MRTDKKEKENLKREKTNTKSWLCTLLAVVVVSSVFAVAALPASASESLISVDRHLPAAVAPSEQFEVTLTQFGFFFGVGTVSETLPEGFEYVDDSYTGNGTATWVPGTRRLTLKFKEDVTVTYSVTASSSEQTAVFSGTYAAITLDPYGYVKIEGDVGGVTEVLVDETAPYTEGYDPAEGATGVPVDTNIVLHVKDNCAVDPSTIKMTVDAVDVTSQLTLTPRSLSDYRVTYNPSGNLNYNHLYTIKVDATDATGNVMPQKVYSFTTEAGGSSDPIVSNPNADPQIIPDDTDHVPLWGELSDLSVVVTDDSTVTSVTIDLSAIGGSAMQPMSRIGGSDVWSVSKNASAGTDGWSGTAYTPYLLPVTATDEHGNSNTDVSIELTVMKNGDVDVDGSVNLGDGIHLSNYALHVSGYEIPAELLVLADVDGNGDVNLGDGIYLSNYALHVSGYDVLH